jgi:hypothetical protein
MNRIWANRLEANTKKWNDVPANRKEAVKAILAEDVANGIITSEQYEMITGKVYEA